MTRPPKIRPPSPYRSWREARQDAARGYMATTVGAAAFAAVALVVGSLFESDGFGLAAGLVASLTVTVPVLPAGTLDDDEPRQDEA